MYKEDRYDMANMVGKGDSEAFTNNYEPVWFFKKY